jgi:hypothetical protein
MKRLLHRALLMVMVCVIAVQSTAQKSCNDVFKDQKQSCNDIFKDQKDRNSNAGDGRQPTAHVETSQERNERQIREMVERKMQNRSFADIATGKIIGEAVQREFYSREATFEIIERDRIQHENNIKAENARAEQNRIERERRAREHSEVSGMRD